MLDLVSASLKAVQIFICRLMKKNQKCEVVYQFSIFLTLDEYLYFNSNGPGYKLNVPPFIFMFYSIQHIISSFFSE